MFKLFNRQAQYGYTIAFCDTQDINTKFGSWGNIFDTYKEADFVIRMNWPQAIKVLEGQYKLSKNEWLIVERVEKKTK